MSKLIIENKEILGLPLNEYYMKNIQYKGLIFLQHGFGSKKERGTDYLAINLARLGYFCVSIDAYKHGERIEEPYISKALYLQYYEAYDVIENTAKDILLLFNKHYKKKYKNFDFIGISLGGMIGYYLSTITDNISKLIPAISSPMFTRLATIETDLEQQEKYDELLSAKKEYIKELDPYLNKNKIKFKSMFICNGTKDPVISHQHSVEFVAEMNNDLISIKLYEEGHVVSRKMQEDILGFIASEKVVL
ncbi:MAG: hypothetical protein QM489_01590 [Candidatus Izemoplasma sp.]